VITPALVLDVFGFTPASEAELPSAAHRFARHGDLIDLDAVATGSGAFVIRQPQRVTVLTDLAGVWPLYFTTVADSLIYSSSAAAIAADAGGQVDEQWLASWLLVSAVPETWSQASPYRQLRAVPAGGVLLAGPGLPAVIVRRERALASAGFRTGTQRLASALSTAVRGRAQRHQEISTDLSGGLDSSAVA
jgi:asparagine synthase (glutamine-hydrolysing)